MKLIKITIVLVAFLMALSVFCGCARTTDISGYYMCETLDNLYYFSPDGKIYVNESYESYSLYEVKGNKIITSIEDAENSELEFDFKKTENGFMMGEIEYIRLPDYEDFADNKNTDETAE